MSYTFKVSRVENCAIQQPRSGIVGGVEHYMVCFPVDDLPDGLRKKMPIRVAKAESGRTGLFCAKSPYRPRVFDFTSDYSDLRHLYAKLDDTNYPLGQALKGMPAELHLRVFETRGKPRLGGEQDPWAVDFAAIRFDAASIKVPGWDDITGGSIT